jgi:hypothetical protein
MLNPGTIVRALIDIHDDASNRTIPQHARPGDLGVIEEHDDDECPTVNWGAGTGFGVYDSPLHHFEVAVHVDWDSAPAAGVNQDYED